MYKLTLLWVSALPRMQPHLGLLPMCVTGRMLPMPPTLLHIAVLLVLLDAYDAVG